MADFGFLQIPVESKSLRRSWKYSQQIRLSTSFDQSSGSVLSPLTLSIESFSPSEAAENRMETNHSGNMHHQFSSTLHYISFWYIKVHRNWCHCWYLPKRKLVCKGTLSPVHLAKTFIHLSAQVENSLLNTIRILFISKKQFSSQVHSLKETYISCPQ